VHRGSGLLFFLSLFCGVLSGAVSQGASAGPCIQRVTPDEYKILYPEIQLTSLDPESHYLRMGAAAGLCPVVKLASKNSACQGKPLKEIFVIAGQSNAQGLGRTAEIPPHFSGFQLWAREGYRFQIWIHGLASSWLPGHLLSQTESFGFEVGLAAALQSQGRSDFLIYKSAASGSALRTRGDSNEWRSRGQGGIYDATMVDLRAAAEQVCNSGFQPIIRSFFWMQGESDSLLAETADEYEANLSRLISELRDDVMSPTTPVVIGKIRSGPDSLWTYADKINAAQTAVARKMADVTTIETNDLSYYPAECTQINPGYCRAHYDSLGLLKLGARFHAGFQSIEATQAKNLRYPPGFYRLGTTPSIYRLDEAHQACVFVQWTDFLNAGGKPDLSNVTSILSYPQTISYQEACRPK
jgi:hypothetical protein